MRYPGWPNITLRCPRCGRDSCAVYRGYYTRLLFCPEMEFFGRVVIRTGYCKAEDQRFALLPDFLIPRRRISRLSQEALTQAFLRLQSNRLTGAIDELVAGLGDEFYLPRSTAHSYLHPKFAVPP